MSCCSSCYSPQRGSRGLQGVQGPVGDTGANAPEIFMTSSFTGGVDNPLDPIENGGSFEAFSWTDTEIGQTILVNVNLSVNDIAADGSVVVAISWAANQVSIFPTAIVFGDGDNPISIALTKTVVVPEENPLVVFIEYAGSGGTSLSISNVSVSIIVTPAPP